MLILTRYGIKIDMECSLVYVGDQSEEISTKLFCLMYSYLHRQYDLELEESDDSMMSDLEEPTEMDENEKLLEMEDL